MTGRVQLGLRENAAQFSLLVGLNAFVGAMVGLERSTLPLIGETEFGLGSSAAVLSFVVAFGLAWLILSGVLAVTFRKARTLIRRMVERRREARPEGERRLPAERRKR